MRPGAERPGLRQFFASRWHGTVAIERLFWTDMVIVGTLINAAAAVATVSMLGLKWPVGIAVATYLSPVPYNVFLVVAVWRATEGMGGAASTYRAGALIWLVLVFII